MYFYPKSIVMYYYCMYTLALHKIGKEKCQGRSYVDFQVRTMIDYEILLYRKMGTNRRTVLDCYIAQLVVQNVKTEIGLARLLIQIEILQLSINGLNMSPQFSPEWIQSLKITKSGRSITNSFNRGAYSTLVLKCVCQTTW